MTTDNEPINPLPDVLPDVDLPCTCGCKNSLGGARLDSTREYYATRRGNYALDSVPWSLVRAALAKPVAPASLAAEQRHDFKVGDWVSGVAASGAMYTGPFDGPSQSSGKDYSRILNGGPGGIPMAVRTDSLRHESPPSAKRPECDACGEESCDSSNGLTNYDCARWHDETIGKAFGVEVLHLCGKHWNQSAERTVREIRARRKQLASGSAGSVQREQCESGSPALNRTEKPATEPPEPGRPSRDPYAGCSDFLREGIVGAAMREHDAARLAAMTPKQRQAAEMLLRPARPKVYRAHPASWPEQSYDDVDELGSS